MQDSTWAEANMTKPASAAAAEKGADFFLVKFWTHMLQNPECKDVCEWAPDGRHLIIYDPDVLMAEIKSRGVCKQKNYDSFARQLRIYRWGRVKAEDCGVSPLPEQVKVWRHPRLNRDSPLVDVANVTRNAPPKPNKAALAAGMADQKESKPRQKATDIYEDGDMDTDERRDGDSSSDESEDELQDQAPAQLPATIAQPRAPPPVKPAVVAESNVMPVQQMIASLQAPQVNFNVLQPAATATTSIPQKPATEAVDPTQLTQAQILASAIAKLSKAHNKKKALAAVRSLIRPAFDVETSIFDPNNNFGVTTARPLGNNNSSTANKPGQGNRKHSIDDVSSDSELSSDGGSNARAPRGKSGSASVPTLSSASVPTLSIPQVSQAFLAQVMYDNAAIEHAAHHPANYDRLPWSAPASRPAPPGTMHTQPGAFPPQQSLPVGNNTLASLESRLQSISASLRAADAAALQHAR